MKKNLRKELVNLVKAGQLDKAYTLYLSHNHVYRYSRFFTLRPLVSWFSIFFVLYLKKNRPDLNVDDSAVELDEEFVIFWKCPNVIGRKLLLKIVIGFLKTGEIPARALAWFGHWLVFQGRYYESAIIFKFILSRVIRNSRLHGEVLSLSGNYFYSRGKLDDSIRHHLLANVILKKNGDKFFEMFNLGTSAKTHSEKGDLENFRTNVLLGFDHLDPSEPDERYGMRVLIYYAYLNFINGNIELGKQYYVSAEKCFKTSGSSLDKAIYCAYRAVILIFFRDLNSARESIKEAKRQIKLFGKYKSHEELIEQVSEYLSKGGTGHRVIENLLGTYSDTKRSELEAWYRDFFTVVLPILENFQDADLGRIVGPLSKVTNSSVQVRLKRESLTEMDILDACFQVSDASDGTTVFEVDLFHQNKLHELRVSTNFKRWRNLEIFESIRSTLYLFQGLSKQNQLRKIADVQALEIKESETARRIAHDIKSPLAALQVALNSPALDLSIIKASTQKIEDIAHGLSRNNREGGVNKVNRVLVRSLVDSILSSKRIEYQGKSADISLKYLNESGSRYLEINELEMSRTLSNIINNAVESYPDCGPVSVIVNATASCLEISVQDFGCGIVQEDQEIIFAKDISFKKSGSGLGLYYAKQYLESCSGSISVQSVIGKGTTFTLKYPLSAPPAWISTTLFLDRYTRVVIADDFIPNIDMMKRKVLDDCPDKEVLTFTSLTELEEFMHSNNHETTFFILDYDFNSETSNGREFILQNNLIGKSVLATHHYEDPQVIKDISDFDVKMVPKIIFSEIKIVNRRTNIYIADDEKYFLKTVSDKLNDRFVVKTFDSAEKLLIEVQRAEEGSFFFIDRHFTDSGIMGESVLSSLSLSGKSNLFNISEDSSFFHAGALKIRKSEIVHILS